MDREREATSLDAVLGGRLRLHQPLRGHRVGHDAILLAAATGARPGERAFDLGAGVGAAGLALAQRVSGLDVTLVEIDPALSELAAENAAINGLDERVQVLTGDVEDVRALTAAGVVQCDRVLMNPPFNDPRRQNPSPQADRRRAHAGGPSLLRRWVRTAAELLKPVGVLTLIWRADARADVIEALAETFGDIAVLPVLPRPGAPAIRILVRAMKDARAGITDVPVLVLNDADGRPSSAAEAILRGGETLLLAEL